MKCFYFLNNVIDYEAANNLCCFYSFQVPDCKNVLYLSSCWNTTKPELKTEISGYFLAIICKGGLNILND